MTPKYFRTETPNRDRWMVSYMDVLTILLIFFVGLAAQGLQHYQEYTTLPVVPSKHPASAGAIPSNIASAIAAPVSNPRSRQALLDAQKSLAQHGLDLRLEQRGLVISLPQAILFSSGEDRVSGQALPILGQIAEVLRGMPNEVSLVGHADSVPIHNRHFKNNWDLSMARSLKILELLSTRYEIPESRLHIASYGAWHPNGPNDTADGRARNRRVEIVISDGPASE